MLIIWQPNYFSRQLILFDGGEREEANRRSDYRKISSPTKMQHARYRDGLSKLFATGYEKARSSLQKVVLRFPSTEAKKTLDKILLIEKEVNHGCLISFSIITMWAILFYHTDAVQIR